MNYVHRKDSAHPLDRSNSNSNSNGNTTFLRLGKVSLESSLKHHFKFLGNVLNNHVLHIACHDIVKGEIDIGSELTNNTIESVNELYMDGN